MKNINNCPICNSNHFQNVIHPTNKTKNLNDIYSVIQCQNCLIELTNPQPEHHEIGKYYDEEFVSYQFELSKNSDSLKGKLFNHLIYLSAKQKLNFTESIASFNSDTKLLDVGCGKQIFLKEVKNKHNCEVLGVDFSNDVVDYCNNQLNVPCQQGNVDNINKQDYYDVITMWHYLEHESEPIRVLKKSFQLLKPGGKIVIEVPNSESLENKIFGRESYLRDMPRHLFHFSPLVIEKILNSQGFKIEKIDYPIFSGGLIGTVQNILFKGNVYKNLKDKIYYFAILSYLLAIFDVIFSSIKKGSIIRIVAVKPEAQILNS